MSRRRKRKKKSFLAKQWKKLKSVKRWGRSIKRNYKKLISFAKKMEWIGMFLK